MSRFENLIFPIRRPFVVAVHLLLVVLANEAAFALRFDGQVPESARLVQLQMLPWLVVIRGLLFTPFGLYRGLWRFAGLWDLRNIVLSVGASTLVFWVATLASLGGPSYPRSVVLIDALVITFALGGLRLVTRVSRSRNLLRLRPEPTGTRVLIYGAGEAGESIVRDIRSKPASEYAPVGFVDDDRSKVGQTIHGVAVLGTRDDLSRIMTERRPAEVLIAMPAAQPATIRSVVKAMESFRVRITVLPHLRDLLNREPTVDQIRSLKIEDLLPRARVELGQKELLGFVADRRVLVTGAGGSIGSELCKQIAALRPTALVLYERSENSLYEIASALADQAAASDVYPLVGDITDPERLESAMTAFRPELVFHAAAHKHVPLMESNLCEAVKNNVGGTRLVAEAAARHGVERFILISTDKAVNPTSVMGVTKRVGELVVMSHRVKDPTTFITVRFGNVLGSNGSVVPRFMEQISSGGPVTVTHPDIRRYFMLLPEAVQLVLRVAAHGRAGETYVLDMGDQIKIADMARNLIRLCGYVPDEEIRIAFTGLRPGEKLFEELVGRNERVRPSMIESVSRVCADDMPDPAWLAAQVRRLEALAHREDAAGVTSQLQRIVPDFTLLGTQKPSATKLLSDKMRLLHQASLETPAAS